MSSATWNELWREAVEELLTQLEIELPEDPRAKTARAVSARKEPHEAVRAATELALQGGAKGLGIGKKGHPGDVFEHQALLYIRYTLIYKKLEECYDQMVHPQKLLDVRKLLDAVMGRMLELKQWLVSFQCTEFPLLDDVLLDLKLSPADLEIRVPRYYTSERKALLRDRESLLDGMIAQREQKAAEEGVIKETGPSMSVADAIRMIQRNERARAGRARARQLETMRAQDGLAQSSFNEPLLDVEAASNLITRVARGHLCRREVEEMRREELQLIGMDKPEDVPDEVKPTARRQQAETQRKVIQMEHKKEYEDELKRVKQKIYEREGPQMKEQMQDEIRQWFLSHYRQTGKFPGYPSHLEGGSAKIFLEPPQIEEEYEDPREKEKREKAEAEAKKKAEKEESDEDKIEIPPSFFIKGMQEGCLTYNSEWQAREEMDNFAQKHDVEMIRERTRPVVAAEIRVQVDEVMRLELENLKIAVESEKKKKKKKSTSKKKDAARGGGGGGGGASEKPKAGAQPIKSKKKKVTDMTADVSTEQLFAMLVHNDILQKCPRAALADYWGEPNLLAATMRDAGIDADPSMADIRKVIAETCCLPLGCALVHEADPGPWTKSVLLCGPAGSGKSLLARAIVTETGANLFNLTPSNTYGKFPGKMTTLMLHMVFKVAKLMAPSVILIDEVDKVFTKKPAKEDRGVDGPKRIKKDLLKQVKQLKPEHRVLVLGLSRRPFDADLKGLCSFFPKCIMLPAPDYGTRRLLWERKIAAYGGTVSPSLDISTLAHITGGYTSGSIDNVCKKVLTTHRLSKMAGTPLTTDEFIAALATLDPIYKEDDEQLRAWFAKTPLARARRKKQEEEAAAEEERKNNRNKRR